jgi:hypothetical protein
MTESWFNSAGVVGVGGIGFSTNIELRWSFKYKKLQAIIFRKGFVVF